MCCRPLLVLAATSLLVPGVLACQKPTGPYGRYARAITSKADSAANALNTVFGPGGQSGDVPQRIGRAGREARRLAGDFDAVVPPPDLTRVHTQLVTPLKDLASRLERVAGLYNITCESASMGPSCDLAALKVVATRRAQAEVGGLMTPVADYLEARARASRMLREHSVELPEIKATGGSTATGGASNGAETGAATTPLADLLPKTSGRPSSTKDTIQASAYQSICGGKMRELEKTYEGMGGRVLMKRQTRTTDSANAAVYAVVIDEGTRKQERLGFIFKWPDAGGKCEMESMSK